MPKPKEVKIEPVAVSMASHAAIPPSESKSRFNLADIPNLFQPNNTSSKPLRDLDIADEDRLAMEAMMDMSDNFDMPSSSAMVQPMDEDEDDEGPGSSTLISISAVLASDVPRSLSSTQQ